MLIDIVGVAVLVGPRAIQGFSLTNVAQLACLGAAFVYACAAIYSRRFRQMGLDPIVTATGQVCGSTIILIPLAAFADRPWTLGVPAVGTLGAWIGLAVLARRWHILFFSESLPRPVLRISCS